MHAVLFVYQRAFTPELIIQRPVKIRIGTAEFLRIVLTRPVVCFYRLLTKIPLSQPPVRSGRHYGNLLPSSPIAPSILRKTSLSASEISSECRLSSKPVFLVKVDYFRLSRQPRH
jgi:hypothetical protein